MAIAAGLVIAFLMLSSHTTAQTSQKTDTVTVQGCPFEGVGGGCIMVTGEDGVTYDVSSASPKPNIGTFGIKATGTKSDQPNICMQGIRLDHVTWNYTKQNCPKKPPAK
jgi:hypothetical protein